MKFVQWFLAAVGAVALVVVLVGVLLPSAYEVRRSTRIEAPAQRIYDAIVEPRQWTKWSVWTRRDPQMRITYGGPPFGMGARWSWDSPKEGSGSMEFTHVEPNRRVEYTLYFPSFNMRSSGELKLEPDGAGTRVTWVHSGDTGGNPLKHYIAAAMDRMVGPDLEQGLANLKTLAEKP